jgi:Fe-S cluster biosynthesis and repair protein YggX
LFVISFPLVIRFFSEFLAAPSDNFFNKKWRWEFFIVKPFFIAALLVIISSRFIGTRFITDPFNHFSNKYPRDAIYFLKNHPEYDNLKLVERYSWGGYLMWALPERKLFIDGRLPQYPFAGRSLLEEYMDFFNKERIEVKISKYNIGIFLIPAQKDYLKLGWFEKYALRLNEEKINNYNDELKNYLSNSDKWRLVYHDKTSDIYIKK